MTYVSQQQNDNNTTDPKPVTGTWDQTANFSERPALSLQENLITILAYREEGRLLIDVIRPELFEGDNRLIVERVVEYWSKYNAPPKMHTADLFSKILSDPYDRRAAGLRRTLQAMHDIQGLVNTEFVLDDLRQFKIFQSMKDVTIKVAEILNAKQHYGMPEVKELLQGIIDLDRDTSKFEPWCFGDVDRIFDQLQLQQGLSFGIDGLDSRHVVPNRGGVSLLLSGTGMAKSWFLMHVGKHAVVNGYKVVHVTLEMTEPYVMQRYWQSCFGLTRYDDDDTGFTQIQRHSDGTLSLTRDPGVNSGFCLTQDDARTRTRKLLNWHPRAPTKFAYRPHYQFDKRLKVYRLPAGGEVLGELRTLVRDLHRKGFEPDYLIVDYIGKMSSGDDKMRYELGHAIVGLEALAQEFNLSVVTAQQLNRTGTQAEIADLTHIAEASALTHTADTILIYAQNKDERLHKLARLQIAKNRHHKHGFAIAIAQNYECGQFALDSCPCDDEYQALRDGLGKKAKTGDDTKPSTKDRVIELLKEGKTQTAIAKELGISKGRVSQIKKSLDSEGSDA